MGAQIRIVIVQAGWVFVGRYSVEGGEAVIRDGYNLRRWGTDEGAHRGLGRLAENGPERATQMDRVTTIRLPYHAVIGTMDCVASRWEELCKPR